MLLLKYLLLAAGIGLFAGAAAIIAYDVYVATQLRRLLGGREAAAPGIEPARPVGLIRPVRWSVAGKLAGLAWLPLLLGLSIVVVPDGTAGVRVSQISGVRPGTLYPGVHFVLPLVEHVAEYNVRDHVFTTIAAEDPKKKGELLRVTGREGLSIARDLRHAPGGTSAARRRRDHRALGRRRHRGERSHGARHRAARRIRQGLGRTAAEGTGE